jgi:type IV pilus assembly protein PilC
MTAQSTFAFRARDNRGEVVTGSMIAGSAQEVSTRLRNDGKFLLSVEDNPHHSAAQLDIEQLRRNEAAKRVKREDVIAFCQQLSVMLETGVPLTEALDAFCKQTQRKEFREVLGVISSNICGGEPLSLAMSRWPRVFPTMVVSLMKASEASGTMSQMLGRIGEYLAKERRTAKQIKGALGYPVFMMVAGVVMTIFLMIFVLPRFASIYAQNAATLPLPTKVLLSISQFITQQYMFYLPGLMVAIIGTVIWIKKPSGRRVCDWLRLNIPLLRSMYRQLYMTRAARTMSTLLGAGVNLLDIISICRGVTNNSYYDDLWTNMEQGVRDGRQISDAVFQSQYITPNVASMIASGERSGRLAEVMGRIALFTEEELDSTVKNVTSYIEPIMIMCMGVIVGGVAMALLLPIFSMGKVMTS